MMLLAAFLLESGLAAWAGHAPPPVAQSNQKTIAKDLQESLRAAIQDPKNKFGVLEPWQQTLVDEDILPQYQRFIRDYRPSASGLQVDVDLESLHNYLAYSAHRQGKNPTTKMMVLTYSHSGCDKCEQEAQGFRKLLKTRLEHRGFTLIWLAREDISTADLSGAPLASALSNYATSKGIGSSTLAEVFEMPIDSIDSAHADEKHFQASLFINSDSDHSDGKLEILSNESFSNAIDKLLSDSFTQFGAKVLAEKKGPENMGQEVTLQMSGIKDFSQYTEFKAAITDRLKDFGPLSESKISRSHVWLTLLTQRGLGDIQEQLKSLEVGSNHLSVSSIDAHSLNLEIE